jgi:catechol 2,3-dioxygenase-like lactoylglutathione lyase family enzyme/DNA-binding CsgD family transcriptional regulator
MGAMTRRRGRPPHPDVLTPAEWRVLDGVRHGMSNREIAERRGTSLDAVKAHVASALAKLEVRGRAGLRYWRGRPAIIAPGRSIPSPLEGEGEGGGSAVTDELALGPLGQVSMGVSDIERAVAFYGGALGLTHLYTFGNLAFFDCGGTRLFLNTERPGGSVLYFRVPDIEAAYDRLGARGVAFLGAPHRIHTHEDGTEEWMAFFNDPDGNTLALMSQVKPAG